MEGKWKVAFLCKNNTCRSQIAEALAKRLAAESVSGCLKSKKNRKNYTAMIVWKLIWWKKAIIQS